MIFREYFIADGVPIESIVKMSPVVSADPRTALTIDGQKFATASVSAATHAAYDVPDVPMDLVLGDERYSQEEYAEKFGRYVDQDGGTVDSSDDGATLTYVIQPDSWSPKRNDDMSLSDAYKSSPYWAGPSGWVMRDGVKAVEVAEYVKARIEYDEAQAELAQDLLK